MKQLKSMLTGGLVTLTLCLILVAVVLTVSNVQSVQADMSSQPGPTIVDEQIHYLPLTDAPPQRNIASQRFAPSVDTP